MKIKLEKIANILSSALFPNFSCAICGSEMANNEYGVCDSCKESLNVHNGSCCRKCGEPLDFARDFCPACAKENYEFDRAVSFCEYNETSGKLIKDLKYNNKRYIAKIIAKFLLNKIEEHNLKFDVITFVPAMNVTLKERGFNQGELIGEELSLLTNIKLENLLERSRGTRRQATLSGKERKENLKGAFALSSAFNIKGKTVLIVDDVFSTGTTLSECSKALKTGKLKKIIALTLAKVHFLSKFTNKE